MDINSYVWKDARLTHNRDEKQVETRLVDMDEDQLQMVYNHCKEMLYNPDPKNAGRMIIIDQIAKQLDYCGAELALRWFKTIQDKDGNYIYSNETLMSELRSWTDGCDPSENYTLKDLVQVPAEYRNVSLNSLQLACRDALGSFDHSKITHSFIYKMGIFLTQEELREIDSDLKDQGLNPDNYTLQTKIENHIKLPLNVLNVDLKVNPKGLSGTEFRDMINIKHLKGYRMCKYSVLTTSQLRTLRSKVLCALEDRTKWQAKKWKEIMSQIEEVAKYKHFKLS